MKYKINVCEQEYLIRNVNFVFQISVSLPRVSLDNMLHNNMKPTVLFVYFVDSRAGCVANLETTTKPCIALINLSAMSDVPMYIVFNVRLHHLRVYM